MATVIVTEAPGGLGDVYRCPTCSMGYPSFDDRRGGYDDKGNVVHPVRAPDTCERCGSPMDIEKGVLFQDAMAEKAAEAKGMAAHRTIKV